MRRHRKRRASNQFHTTSVTDSVFGKLMNAIDDPSLLRGRRGRPRQISPARATNGGGVSVAIVLTRVGRRLGSSGSPLR
jgi:hypothetical protein